MFVKKLIPGFRPMKRRQVVITGISVLLALTGLGLLFILWMDTRIARIGRSLIVDSIAELSAKPYDCVIVPGALVRDGQPSPMLQDRLDMALAIYRAGGTDRILVSGDHGQTDYDEVNVMRQYLLDRGVPAEQIFMDHAGFDTYDTLYRAQKVFAVRRAVVTTQTFHLLRAMYIGRELGLDVQGVASDLRPYYNIKRYRVREYIARFKAFLDCEVWHSKSMYLGPVIPITGSGLATVDD